MRAARTSAAAPWDAAPPTDSALFEELLAILAASLAWLARLRRVRRFERPARPQDGHQHEGPAQVSGADDAPKRRWPLRTAGSAARSRHGPHLPAHTRLALGRAEVAGGNMRDRLWQRGWER